jgi:hypothetical protein
MNFISMLKKKSSDSNPVYSGDNTFGLRCTKERADRYTLESTARITSDYNSIAVVIRTATYWFEDRLEFIKNKS